MKADGCPLAVHWDWELSPVLRRAPAYLRVFPDCPLWRECQRDQAGATDGRNEGALPSLRQASGKVIPAAGLWPFWVMDGLSSMLAGRWSSLIYCSVIKTKNVCSVGCLVAFRNCKLNTNQKGLFKTYPAPSQQSPQLDGPSDHWPGSPFKVISAW